MGRHTFCNDPDSNPFSARWTRFPRDSVGSDRSVRPCRSYLCLGSAASAQEVKGSSKHQWEEILSYLQGKYVRNDWTRCSGEQHGDSDTILKQMLLDFWCREKGQNSLYIFFFFFESFYFQNNGSKNVVKYLLPTAYHRDIATYHIAECSFLFNRFSSTTNYSQFCPPFFLNYSQYYNLF